MSDLQVHQPDTTIGAAPAQQLHVVDDRDLRQFETSGFSLYLALALACIPAALGIGATIATWHGASSPDSGVFDSKWGYFFFALTVALLSAGIAFLIPALRNFSSTKSLVAEIRNRRKIPPKGEQETENGSADLAPVVRRQDVMGREGRSDNG